MTKIIRREVRKRGFFGHVFKWGFILFNIVMLIWLIVGLGNVGKLTETLQSEVERNGAAAGATIGVAFILMFWAAGDVILGLLVMFTRGKVTIIEQTIE